MRKVVFLSCNKIKGFHPSDEVLRIALEKSDYEVHIRDWDTQVDWTQYDAVIFRSTWDYFEREEEFRSFLKNLEKLDIKIFNSLNVVNKNIHKFYLKEFEEQGVNIIPSVFINKGSNKKLINYLPSDWKKMVIKPAFSGGAYLTKLFDVDNINAIEKEYEEHLKSGDFIIQQFIPEVMEQGEVSLIFFNKVYSHSIIKKPMKGDFRVQSQFGGQYSGYTATQNLIDTATHIMSLEKEDLLYARVDGIIVGNEFYLMELELIEPDLFTMFDEEAAKRFVTALDTLMDK